jgi:protein-S-isoprenylcysteine O-methyltransferase Ste14
MSPTPQASLTISAETDNTADVSEIIGRALLITLMSLVAAGSFTRMQILLAQPDPLSALDFLGELGAFVFSAMVCLLAVLRLKPVRRATGWAPLVSALSGAFILTIVNHLPMANLSQSAQAVSVLLLAVGNVATVVCLVHLGRSFSVLPQARKLVRSGPYGLIRHPLYVAEAIATMGMVMLHLGWAALFLGVVQTGLQLARIHYEEKVLQEAFPEYRDYASDVPRFFPKLF